jgi:hypothetical protein
LDADREFHTIRVRAQSHAVEELVIDLFRDFSHFELCHHDSPSMPIDPEAAPGARGTIQRRSLVLGESPNSRALRDVEASAAQRLFIAAKGGS